MRLRPLLIALAALFLTAVPLSARAQVEPADLAASDVVVEPAAAFDPGERDRLVEAARELRERGTPTKFVVVAARPTNPPQLAQDLRRAIGFNGNVLLLSQSPRSLGIASGLPSRAVQQAFEASLPELQADPVSGTIAVAERLANTSRGGSRAPGSPGPPAADDREGGGGGLLFLGLLVLGGLALMMLLRRAGHRRAEEELADQRAGLEPLVDALAAQIGELDGDMRMGGDRARDARPHYDEAVLAYGEVRETLPSAHRGQPLESVRRALERGLRAAQAARAILDGRPPPGPDQAPLLEGLCAFDPKHGRAVRRVRIVTPAGDEATLPVCRSCAEGLEHGEIPEVRRVPRHGEEVPYWQSAGTFGFGGGLFPMFGGMLGGMMLHDLLTPDVTVVDEGDYGRLGDFGGGDFGGGDFGGGDF